MLLIYLLGCAITCVALPGRGPEEDVNRLLCSAFWPIFWILVLMLWLDNTLKN